MFNSRLLRGAKEVVRVVTSQNAIKQIAGNSSHVTQIDSKPAVSAKGFFSNDSNRQEEPRRFLSEHMCPPVGPHRK